MNTVVGAIVWCYDMTVDDDPPGTYYVPSFAELVVFNDNYETLKEIRPDLIESLRVNTWWYYGCNYMPELNIIAWSGAYLTGKNWTNEGGVRTWGVRCVRQKT